MILTVNIKKVHVVVATLALFSMIAINAYASSVQKTKNTVDVLSQEVYELKEDNKALKKSNIKLLKENEELRKTIEELTSVQENENVIASQGDHTYAGQFEITCYNSGTHGADGTPVYEGMIAVDPDVIPLGTEVYIEFPDGDWAHLSGIYKAHDVGGAVNGNIIDMYRDWSDHEALAFGRRDVNVYIVQ